MTYRRRTGVLAAAACAFLTCAFATGGACAQTKATPPCQDEIYRAFDFWIGAWEVTTPDGKIAGDNLIESAEAGCLIVERWRSAGGGTGQSYNFYDPGLEQWRQVWVSPGATIDYAGGLNDAGEMVLEGTINYHAGTSAPFRGVWTPLEDGRVKQHFDQYDLQAEEWKPWFTGFYARKPEPAAQEKNGEEQ